MKLTIRSAAPLAAALMEAAVTVLADPEISAATTINPKAAGIHAPCLVLNARRAADLTIELYSIVVVGAAIFTASVIAFTLYGIIVLSLKG